MALGQNTRTQTVTAEALKKVFIETTVTSDIVVNTTSQRNVVVTVNSYGELQNQSTIILQFKNQAELHIKEIPSYPEFGNDDKLGAHKVYSNKILLQLPEGLEVVLQSQFAEYISLSGNYKTFSTSVTSGFIKLQNITGDIIVQTRTGTIEAEIPDLQNEFGAKQNTGTKRSYKTSDTTWTQLHTITGKIRLKDGFRSK